MVTFWNPFAFDASACGGRALPHEKTRTTSKQAKQAGQRFGQTVSHILVTGFVADAVPAVGKRCLSMSTSVRLPCGQ